MTYEKALVLLGPLLCGQRVRASQELKTLTIRGKEVQVRLALWDFGGAKIRLLARSLSPLSDEVTLEIDAGSEHTSVWMEDGVTMDFLGAVLRRQGAFR